MTGLSRCGKRYPTFDDAYKAAKLRTGKSGRKYVITSCWAGDHWHVTEPDSPLATAKPHRPDPFPPMVARMIDLRDDRCARCGSSDRLQRHHRRAKASGGSKARAHTQCPCNALRLCWRCHLWAHEQPARARQLGAVVSQSVAVPGRIGVLLHEYDPQLAHDTYWATCDGRWVHSPGETED